MFITCRLHPKSNKSKDVNNNNNKEVHDGKDETEIDKVPTGTIH